MPRLDVSETNGEARGNVAAFACPRCGKVRLVSAGLKTDVRGLGPNAFGRRASVKCICKKATFHVDVRKSGLRAWVEF